MPDMNYCDITIVLDRSGSMSSIKKETEGGFDSFIEEQKKLPGKCVVSLVQFDNYYQDVYTAVPIGDVQPLTLVPRGTTALLDAQAKAIIATGERLAAMPEDQRPGHVVFVTITDGMENSSQEFTNDMVRQKVTEQREKYAWDFIYLGANQDAIAVGTSMGTAGPSNLSYNANAGGTAAAYNSLSDKLGKNRVMRTAGVVQATSFDADDQAAQDANK